MTTRQSLKALKKLHPEIPRKSSRFIFILLSLEKIYTDVELIAAGAPSLWQLPSSSLLVYTNVCVHPLHFPPALHPVLTKCLLFWGTDGICTADLQILS